MKLCDTYEQIFSRTLPESELYRLNHGMLPQKNGAYTVSEPLAELILAVSYTHLEPKLPLITQLIRPKQ